MIGEYRPIGMFIQLQTIKCHLNWQIHLPADDGLALDEGFNVDFFFFYERVNTKILFLSQQLQP